MKKFDYKSVFILSGLLLLTALLIVLLIFIIPERKDTSELPEEHPLPPALPQPEPEELPQPEPEGIPEKILYFVIDDAGYSLEKLQPFLDFPGKLTIAVLPGLDYSEESARRIYESGKEVFLHQPMEAVNGNDPGPSAILKTMDKDAIEQILEHNIKSIPHIKGVNNHMGSKITSDSQIMKIILSVMQRNNLVFLDSLTTNSSAAKEVSLELGFTIAQRDIFLDNVDNREAIMESIYTGRSAAENKGYAVMIGHVWSSELADNRCRTCREDG